MHYKCRIQITIFGKKWIVARITVLGSGMVGSAIARIMAAKHEVRVLDISRQSLDSLPREIKKIKTDIGDRLALQKNIKNADLVIGAVPGFMGFEVMRHTIEAGKNMVDISFFPENAFKLNALARKHKRIVVFDCGVAPGMDNILLGYHDQRMQVRKFTCYVGGLPKIKEPPFEYKAPFSPADVLEEYTRPARLKEKGKEVVKPALTDLEYIRTGKGVKLEAFNSDGLRSLLRTMKHIPDMKEKTLRYPGHASQMAFLRAIGLLDKKPLKLKNNQVIPLELTSSLLFKHWKYLPGEADFTFMRTIVEGIEDGKKTRYTYDLNDEYDPATSMSSMARTTGLTACAAVELILANKITEPGVMAPEMLGQSQECFDFILDYLRDHRIYYRKRKSAY